MSARVATPSGSPARRELRIGLVLYGGVSLAIYIYGVAYEFWRLIRASDLCQVDFTGRVLEGERPVNGAAFAIHSEIHRSRESPERHP